jgi:hypothetical protein
MLTVVSGPFQPALEEAFLERIRELKKNPLTRVAVVTPSNRLMEHLQLLLASSNTPVINVHFHSFASLAEQIVIAEKPLKKTLVTDAHFYDTLCASS